MTRKINGLRVAAAVVGISALALTACTGPAATPNATGGGTTGAASAPITIGTTDKVTSLDPAGSYDNGSFAVMNQVYPFLLNSRRTADPDVKPDIAESAEFTSPDRVHGQAEGRPEVGQRPRPRPPRTSSSPSTARSKIADPNGPSSLLGNLDSVDGAGRHHRGLQPQERQRPDLRRRSCPAPSARSSTKRSSRPTRSRPTTTSSPARPSPASTRSTSYDFNNAGLLQGQRRLQGHAWRAGKTAAVNVKYYADSSNLKLDVQQGNIDVAYRSLSATDVDDLSKERQGQGRRRARAARSATSSSTSTRSRSAPRPPTPTRRSRSPCARPSADLVDREAIADAGLQGHLHCRSTPTCRRASPVPSSR